MKVKLYSEFFSVACLKEAVQSLFNRAPLICHFFFLNTVCESTVLVREKARRSVLCSGAFMVLFFIHRWLFPNWNLKSHCKCKLIVVLLPAKPSLLWIRELSSTIIPCIQLSSILVAKDHWEKNHLKLNYFDYNPLPLHSVWSSLECILKLVIYIIARIDNKTVLVFSVSFAFNKATVERFEAHEALICLGASWSKRFFFYLN